MVRTHDGLRSVSCRCHEAQDDRGISVADDSGDFDENLSHQGRGDQRNVGGVLMHFQSRKSMNAAASSFSVA